MIDMINMGIDIAAVAAFVGFWIRIEHRLTKVETLLMRHLKEEEGE